jgi:hypothetical protein
MAALSPSLTPQRLKVSQKASIHFPSIRSDSMQRPAAPEVRVKLRKA